MNTPTGAEPPSTRALLGLWVRIATADGRRPLSSLAARTGVAYARTVLGIALDRSSLAGLKSDAVPARDVVATHLHHLSLAMVIDAPLDAGRVETFAAILEEAGVTHPLVTDLRSICRGRTLGPRLRITSRILRNRFGTTMLGALGRTLALRLWPDVDGSARYRALDDAPVESFGSHLRSYYRDNAFPMPGMRNGFPLSLVSVHDVAHVLGGFDTTHTGELLVSAFETGVSGAPWADYWVGGMLHCQLGFALEPGAAPARGQFPPERFYAAFSRGVGADRSLVDPTWDFWPRVADPIERVRTQLGLTGRAEVTPGVDAWCGPGGPPYQRPVPEPLSA